MVRLAHLLEAAPAHFSRYKKVPETCGDSHDPATDSRSRKCMPPPTGEPLITRAEDEEGVPGVAAPLVIWLLAFSFAAVWNVFYAVYLLCTNETWGRYAWMGMADVIRKFFNVRKLTQSNSELRRACGADAREAYSLCRRTAVVARDEVLFPHRRFVI